MHFPANLLPNTTEETKSHINKASVGYTKYKKNTQNKPKTKLMNSTVKNCSRAVCTNVVHNSTEQF